MKLLSLVLVNLGRNKRRTILTLLSVTFAIFLYCALGGVLDTLAESIKVGSETGLVTRNKISLVFPLPLSYRDRIAAVPGVKRVSVSNWFGGRDPNDPHNFFAQLGVDAATYMPLYRNAAFMSEQTACVVGEALFKRMKWKLGQTVPINGTIYPGSWEFTIRAVYRAKRKSFGEENLLFHWKYLDQHGMGGRALVGIYVLELSDPARASAITREVDAMFENSAAATRTETERAFQAGFISMYGNVPFVLRVIGLAVVFAILLVAANTMAMAIRERTSEIGVLKTLGFEHGTIFRLVLIEAAVITLGGGALGALSAKLLIEGSHFNAMGFLPPMTVRWSTVTAGVGMAVLIGAVSGLIPAWQASRLRIVQALRPAE
ncbi:MAG: ABC transporter permease [Candidatus Eisenbacteria bacterium]|uniref:ABC transporter permease n=1 Tax=Eiseniibacteriota bacterium TaxID=2212470 RepID=A0A538SDT0_UNCEI|nr:MAG: ABC transporter permease [Candidatus Eisenbacteria bacterium]